MESEINIGVFLLDDDADIRLLLENLFRSNNIPNVEIFSHQKDFLNAITGDISIAVIDHFLADGVLGMEVMKQLFLKNKQCRVIIMSAQDNDEVTIDYWDAGAAGFVKKGKNDFSEKLISKVNAELEYLYNLFAFFKRATQKVIA